MDEGLRRGEEETEESRRAKGEEKRPIEKKDEKEIKIVVEKTEGKRIIRKRGKVVEIKMKAKRGFLTDVLGPKEYFIMEMRQNIFPLRSLSTICCTLINHLIRCAMQCQY